MPLVSSDFLFRLHGPFYLALASLATVATVAVRPHAPLVRVLGAILALGSTVCAVLLLLSLGRIRTFGVQPTLTDIVVQFAGIRLGVGIWVIVAGLISLALGGAVLTLQSGRPALRRGAKPGGNRRGQTARSRTGIANKGRRS